MSTLKEGALEYWKEKQLDMYNNLDSMTLFSQVIAKQAIHIIEMHFAVVSGNSRKISEEWNSINKLNDVWVRIIFRRYFHRRNNGNILGLVNVSIKMVNGYTNTMAKIILGEPITDEWLDEVIKIESQFFSTIPGQSHQEEETRKVWMNYTSSILKLLGSNDQKYYTAVQCVIYGRLLGTWLDKLFI